MITRISEADETLREFVEKPLGQALELLDTSAFKRTILASLSLTGRIDFICQGILLLLKQEHIYPAKILTRSLIEHFLKSQYLFTRWAVEKNDTVGEEYMLFCNFNEEVDLASAYKRQGKLMGSSIDETPFEAIRSLHPQFASLTDAEIRQKALQFSYKKIIEYISFNVYKTGFRSEEAFLPNILPHYTDLSSFVHGGPMADRLMAGLNEDEMLIPKIQELAELSVSISSAAKLFTLIMISNIDQKFIEPTVEYRRLLETLNLYGGNSGKNKSN